MSYQLDPNKGAVRVDQNYGFFSNCSVRLMAIIHYFNQVRALPLVVDSSRQFGWYKPEGDDRDVTGDYFEMDEMAIPWRPTGFHHIFQYSDYRRLQYSHIVPFVKKYFSPSPQIRAAAARLEEKYNVDYGNMAVLFYRGNDKIRETTLCSYEDVVERGRIIENNQPGIRFLIQSDETEFIERMKVEFPHHVVFNDEIRHVSRCVNTVDLLYRSSTGDFSKLYLAITIVMSQCKYIVCGSGNCDLWVMLYRGNADNVYQFVKGKWSEPLNALPQEENVSVPPTLG